VGSDDAHDFSNIPTDPTDLVVHPELKIANYLHIMSRFFTQQTPPFNYISASEFPCRLCALWLSQLNCVDQRYSVEIRGSSYKWPHDWRMPAVSTEEIPQYIKNFAWGEYLKAQTNRGEKNLVPLGR